MEIIHSKEKALEMQKEICRTFAGYFGCKYPVFKNGKEAEKAINSFFEWRNTKWKVPGKGKAPEQLWLEDKKTLLNHPKINLKHLHKSKMIGAICDEICGLGFFPDYGFVKELFKADYKKIKNFEGIVYDLVEDEKFMNSYLLKKLILSNTKLSIEIFSALYKDIKTIEDIMQMFRLSRDDWDDEPTPSVILVRC